MGDLEGMTFHSAEREVERQERQMDDARQEVSDLRRQLAAAQAWLERISPATGKGEQMTDEQLQKLAALAEAATPARWIAERGMGVRLADYTLICGEACESVNVDANMAFIAAARQAVSELLAEVSGLRRQLAECQAEIAAVPRTEIGELCDLIDNSTTAISLDCPAGWAVREWLETYDAADCRQERDAAIADAAELRRQLEHANRWRDTAILEANEARAEAADLRRQLAAVPIDEIDDLYVAYAYAVSGWPEGKAQEFPQVARWLGILPPNRQTVANVRIIARQRPDILIDPDDFDDDTPHGSGKGDE